MANKYFALTKWIGGPDDKKFTSGVPVEWILNFNLEKYNKDDHDPSESHVVEWRDSKKPPKGGWKCYDCHIIAVSDRISKLENHLKIIDGILSPKAIRHCLLEGRKRRGSAEQTSEKSPETRYHSTKSKLQKKSKITSNIRNTFQSSESEDGDSGNDDGRTSGNDNFSTMSTITNKSTISLPESYESQSSDIENQNSEEEEEVSAKTKIQPKKQNSNSKSVPEQKDNQQKTPIKQKPKGCVEPTDNTDHIPRQLRLTLPARSVTGDDADHTAGYEKEPTLRDIMNVLEKNDASIRKLTKDVEELKSNRGVPVRRPLSTHNPGVRNIDESDDDDFAVGKVEVGDPGSGLTVTELEWTSAISKGTHTAMATTLLTALLPTEVLLKSNYKGGKCKIKKSESNPAHQYQAIDERIIKAIKCSVRATYPKKFDHTTFGRAINQKLNYLRNTQNKQDKNSQR